MRDFDQAVQQKLESLIKKKAVVHFPFFANTFALPYHYANAISRDLKWEETRNQILEHNWDDPIPSLVDARVNVFYATASALADFKRKELSLAWNLGSVPFTRFRPRWIFTDYKSSLLTVKRDAEGLFSDKLVSAMRNERVQRVELMTDIPGQTDVIVRHLEGWGLKAEIFTLQDPKDALYALAPQDKVMRLYFYGAPSTTKMLDEPFRFIPFSLATIEDDNDPATITCVCIASPKTNQAPLTKLDFDHLKEYHDSIFTAAANGYTDLVNIWWAYNSCAERKQHSALFKSAKVFARCLRDHHSAVEPAVDLPDATSTLA